MQMNFINPILTYDYLYPVIILIVFIVYCLVEYKSYGIITSISITQLDSLLFVFYLFISFNLIKNNSDLRSNDFYPLVIYPLLYITIRIGKEKVNIRLILGIMVIISLGEVFIGLIQIMNEGVFLVLKNKITGSFGSPAIYSNFLICNIPFIFYFFCHRRIKNRFIESVFFAVISIAILAVLFCTQSRLAFLTLIFQMCVIILLEKRAKFSFTLKGAVLLAVALGGVFVMLLFLKSDSTSGRWFIIKNTLILLKYNFLEGVGIGRFDVVYNNFQENYFRTHTDKVHEYLASYITVAYNDYLQFFLELGLTGMIFMIVILIKLFTIIKQALTGEMKVRNEIKASLVCCLTILFLALFSFPFRLQVIFTIFIITLGLLSDLDFQIFQLNVRKAWLSTIVCVFTFLFTIRLILTYSDNIKWNEVSLYAKNVEVPAPVLIEVYESLIPELGNNTDFLEDYAKKMYIKKHYFHASEILKTASMYSHKYDIYLLLGMCYDKMNQNDLAAQTYLKCSYMVPGLFISRYNLMMIYYKTNNFTLAKRWAGIILKMPVKVNSKTTDKIKKTAGLLYNKI